MKHLKNYEELNEGVKEILIGGLLVLSSIFPANALSSNSYNHNNDKVEIVETKNTISKKELIKALKKLEREGFRVETGNLPISMIIKNLKGDNFTIFNASAQTMGSANAALSQIVKNNGGKQIVKLFKKTGRSIQAIVIVH